MNTHVPYCGPRRPLYRPRPRLFGPDVAGVLLAVVVGALVIGFASWALARDSGDWSESTPARRAWFSSLYQPDSYSADDVISCCGDADAYESDLFEIDPDGTLVAIITDGNGKRTIPDGTRIRIPAEKVVTDKEQVRTNPTGHGWVFIGAAGKLFCYVMPSLL